MKSEKLNAMNRNRTVALFSFNYSEFDTQLEFYTALGFDMTYYQKAPYRYAAVIKENIGEFGFYGSKNFIEDGGIGGCYIYVPYVKEVYEELKANLKAYYGKIPAKGFPRISRLNKTAEDWRFNLTDPVGNTIIIGQTLGDSTILMQEEDKRVKSLSSKFEKAYASAYRFAYSKEDFLAARNTLEVAFRKFESDASKEALFKAKVLRADVLVSLGQVLEAQKIIQHLETMELTQDEAASLTSTVERLNELKTEING